MSMRELKGQDIANRFRIVKSGNLWLVPSQSSKKQYKVDPVAQSCTCPDFEYTGFKCKHQYAVEFTKHEKYIARLEEEQKAKDEHILYLEKLLQGIESGRMMRLTRAVARFLGRA